MDLFFDNPVAALTNGIARALAAAKNAADAQRQLRSTLAKKRRRTPIWLECDRLVAAACRISITRSKNARGQLAFLLDTAPTAKRFARVRSIASC